MALLGESLSTLEAPNIVPARIVQMQKFDAITQALACYAGLLRQVGGVTSQGAVRRLLDPIPFYEVRERLASKLFAEHDADMAQGHDDIEVWLEL